ncbi:MAG: hydantoinase/oxoprolinase N-terminal domain-containing protein [Kouleothrix sp.]
MQSRSYRVGVDIGGTFTDLIIVEEGSGAFTVGKVLTTPDDPSQAIEAVLSEALARAGIAPAEIAQLVHGTTLVTNAMIERKGARTALLATAGFRDAVEIGRENRYDLYDLLLENPRPLVPRYLRFDVPERTLADGTVLAALDEQYVERLAGELAAAGVEAVAVAFSAQLHQPGARAGRPRRRPAPPLICACRFLRMWCPRFASSSAPPQRSPMCMCRRASSAICASLKRDCSAWAWAATCS